MPRPKTAPLSRLGEFGLVALLAKKFPGKKNITQGIGDDTAVLPFTKKKFLLLTTDMLAEGVHFTRAMGARAIGRKALACSISDIAAMGGVPLYAVISLAVPPAARVDFISRIYDGIARLAKKFDVGIVGGDTIKNKHIVINVALVGEVKKNELVLRCGARSGDMIFVTGPLGRSLQSGRHLRFVPRVVAARSIIRKYKPGAMIDISDGLVGDLQHILEASKVGAVLFEKNIPRAPAATLKNALYDGEDFELLFTVSPMRGRRLLKDKHARCRYIGDIVSKEQGLTLVGAKGRRKAIDAKSFTHF